MTEFRGMISIHLLDIEDPSLLLCSVLDCGPNHGDIGTSESIKAQTTGDHSVSHACDDIHRLPVHILDERTISRSTI